jgi:hypothetical protein
MAEFGRENGLAITDVLVLHRAPCVSRARPHLARRTTLGS